VALLRYAAVRARSISHSPRNSELWEQRQQISAMSYRSPKTNFIEGRSWQPFHLPCRNIRWL